MIIGSLGGLLLLCALPLAAISLWRYSALTQVREWRWALYALSLIALIHLAQGTALGVVNFHQQHAEVLSNVIGWLANLGTIAQAALFLTVARALVLMARAQQNG